MTTAIWRMSARINIPEGQENGSFIQMNEQLFLVFSLYTLSDLGDSSNLIGSLSRTMMLYSLR